MLLCYNKEIYSYKYMFPSIKEKRLIYKRTTHTENSKTSKNTGMGKKTEIQKNERLEKYILEHLDNKNSTVSKEYKTCLRCFNTLTSDPKIPPFQLKEWNETYQRT